MKRGRTLLSRSPLHPHRRGKTPQPDAPSTKTPESPAQDPHDSLAPRGLGEPRNQHQAGPSSPTAAQKKQTMWATLCVPTPAIQAGTSPSAGTPLRQSSLQPLPPATASTVSPSPLPPPPGHPESQARGPRTAVFIYKMHTLFSWDAWQVGVRASHMRPQEHPDTWDMGGARPPHQTPGGRVRNRDTASPGS